jgi:hypothetical protein
MSSSSGCCAWAFLERHEAELRLDAEVDPPGGLVAPSEQNP